MVDILVNGVNLLLVIMGLVEFLKRLGVTGKWSILASMIIGLLLGIGYQISAKPPAGFGDWFGAVIFGLGLGLSASGVYDFVTARAPRIQSVARADRIDEAPMTQPPVSPPFVESAPTAQEPPPGR